MLRMFPWLVILWNLLITTCVRMMSLPSLMTHLYLVSGFTLHCPRIMKMIIADGHGYYNTKAVRKLLLTFQSNF